jgi:hypothetical protein
MNGLESARRYSRPERNIGYLVGTGLFAAVWALTNVAPGWQAVPFLSADFTRVLPAINIALAGGAAANVALIAYDPRWFKATLGLATAGLGIFVSLRFLQVFPFTFTRLHYDFTTHMMALVLIALVAAAVLAIVHLVALGNAALRATSTA